MYSVLPMDFATICDIRCMAHSNLDNIVLRQIKYSVVNGKYHIFYDQVGIPRGYVIWADVNRETWRRFVRTGQPPIYSYEWDEGSISIILDLFIPGGISSLGFPTVNKVRKQFRALSYCRNEVIRLHLRSSKKNKQFSRANSQS